MDDKINDDGRRTTKSNISCLGSCAGWSVVCGLSSTVHRLASSHKYLTFQAIYRIFNSLHTNIAHLDSIGVDGCGLEACGDRCLYSPSIIGGFLRLLRVYLGSGKSYEETQ